MKTIYSFQLSLSLLMISLFSFTKVNAMFIVDGAWYNISYDNPSEVTFESVENKDIFEYTVPDTIRYEGVKYKVTAISAYAFSGCKYLTTLTIGIYVTDFGLYTRIFDGLTNVVFNCPEVKDKLLFQKTNIKTVVIGDSVRRVGEQAFAYCYNLTSVTAGDSLKEIGKGAFFMCGNLTSLALKEGVMTIGEEAFSCCNALKNVSIPSTVTTIGKGAFNACYSITHINIPMGVQSIEQSTFQNCSALKTVAIGENVTSIEGWAFYNCSSLSEVSIPENVTTIGDNAFSGCSSLRELTIPDKVINLGFISRCSNLESLSIGKSVVTAVINDCEKLTKVTFHCPEIGEWFSSNNISEVVIGDEVKIIRSEAFDRWNHLESVRMGKGLTEIGENAFRWCSALQEVTIPDEVTVIGDYAFYYCSALTDVTISDKVTTIGEQAFYGCNSLALLKLGKSITTIGEAAFGECSSLKEVSIPDKVKMIGKWAFSSCSSLESLILGKRVESIGDYAFSYCSSLSYLNVGSSINQIGYKPFGDCTLKDVVFDCPDIDLSLLDGVKAISCVYIHEDVKTLSGKFGRTLETAYVYCPEIGNQWFSGCTGLKEVFLGNNVKSIGKGAFYGCTNLTEVTFGRNMTDIDSEAFEKCNNLKKATFNCSVIGTWFEKNNTISEIVMGDDVLIIKERAFKGCSRLTSVTIPPQIFNICDDAFASSGLLTVISEIKKPFECFPFSDKTYMNGILYVPKGTMPLYANCKDWNRFFRIAEVGGDPDGINTIISTDNNYSRWYNTNGHRLSTPRKGVNIIGKRKILVK